MEATTLYHLQSFTFIWHRHVCPSETSQKHPKPSAPQGESPPHYVRAPEKLWVKVTRDFTLETFGPAAFQDGLSSLLFSRATRLHIKDKFSWVEQQQMQPLNSTIAWKNCCTIMHLTYSHCCLCCSALVLTVLCSVSFVWCTVPPLAVIDS